MKRRSQLCLPLLFLFLFTSITFLSCEKVLLAESEEFNTVIPPFDSNYLQNFGLIAHSDLAEDGLVFYNEYATKVVVFDIKEYNLITTPEQLKSKIDQGVNVSQLPKIELLYGVFYNNFCVGVLINGDYYLLKFMNVEMAYSDSEEGLIFDAYITAKYKY